jgi:hypothetical protein
MRIAAAEVQVLRSEDQLWEISDACGRAHSAAGWERADAWAELNSRFARWTVAEIGTRAGFSPSYVAKCIRLARKVYARTRPDWALAYEEESPHLARSTGEVEWYTPPEYILLARRVMGGIDLDPASSVVAQEIVKAQAFYTAADDGLSMAWHGRLWMNPPYKQPLVQQFIEKLVAELDSGAASQAIVLTNDSTDTEWFRIAASRSKAICFASPRVKFLELSESGTLVPGSPLQGQAFFYMGDNQDKFAQVFSEAGLIFRPYA